MIVDLVRNDLARSAKTGTVTVEELLEFIASKTFTR
jgi:anthranilate/para-aminobenzoate synthase component I